MVGEQVQLAFLCRVSERPNTYIALRNSPTRPSVESVHRLEHLETCTVSLFTQVEITPDLTGVNVQHWEANVAAMKHTWKVCHSTIWESDSPALAFHTT